jgi:hypothetical protein
MPPTWDVCILSMSEVQYDARTLNVARSLTRMDKRVCLSGWGNASVAERLQQQGIAAQLRPRPAFPRMALEWGYFMLWNLLRQRHLRARAYWAADLYSLPIAAHLARRFRACLFYDSRELYGHRESCSGSNRTTSGAPTAASSPAGWMPKRCSDTTTCRLPRWSY